MPAVDEFEYSFDNIAQLMEQFVDEIGLESYSLYLMDYGARSVSASPSTGRRRSKP